MTDWTLALERVDRVIECRPRTGDPTADLAARWCAEGTVLEAIPLPTDG